MELLQNGDLPLNYLQLTNLRILWMGSTAISHINAMVDRSEKNGLFENSHLDKI